MSVKKKERELILFKQRNNNKNDGKNKPNEISNSINNDRIVRVIVIVMVMHGNSNNDNDNNISNSNSNNSKNYPDCRNPPCTLRDRRKHNCCDQSWLYKWHCLIDTDCWNRRSDEKVNNHLRSRRSPGIDKNQMNVIMSDPR